MQLNEMAPSLEDKLPPTDTRHRRDLRALEKGDYAKACKPYPVTFRGISQVWRCLLISFRHPQLSYVVPSTAVSMGLSICLMSTRCACRESGL